ncbi:MAG TPA: c-type cytochrome [Lysobacter sp.]|nr:c-type cytochrome [Lysobacter sp.]
MTCKTLLLPTLLVAALAAAPLGAAEKGKSADAKKIARGQYLVTVTGCHDCHTPMKLGPNGPEWDMSRALSGHPQDLTMPPAPKLEMPWTMAAGNVNTAWSGPWGISFTANLTPDPETGLGRWTFQNFKDTIRTGRHMGRGRPILPPMPIPTFKNLTDEDLEAMFAYLRTIPPIRNKVPEPLPPAAPPAAH